MASVQNWEFSTRVGSIADNVLHNIITFAVTSNVTHYFCMASNLTEIRLLTNVMHYKVTYCVILLLNIVVTKISG